MYNIREMNTENKKYPYLPAGRAILYVDAQNQFMVKAKEVARLGSTDNLQPTGAVIVKDGVVIGEGANHSLLGKFAWYNKRHQRGLCVRKFFNVPSGKGYWMCPGCVTNANHAEASAVRDAHNKGNNTNNADLYLWGHWWCCEPCWNSIIGAGVRNVYLLDTADDLFKRDSNKNILGRQFL